MIKFLGFKEDMPMQDKGGQRDMISLGRSLRLR
jgi:hypothetical protein